LKRGSSYNEWLLHRKEFEARARKRLAGMAIQIGAIVVVTVFMITSAAPSAIAAPAPATTAAPTIPGTINPLSIPKWVNQITGPPPVYTPTVITDANDNVLSHEYTVEMTTGTQQILPAPLPTTPVWWYQGQAHDAVTGADLGVVGNSPGATFEAVRGIPVDVTWVNNINVPQPFAVDPTLHWADPNNLGMVMAPFPPYPPGYPQAQSNVPLVTHLHGAEVQSTSDGGPIAWWTASGTHGSSYYTEKPTAANAAVYHYPNAQIPTTLWYHDHALGITRLNVMSGLAGFYLLRDPADTIAPLLPSGQYEVPLAIQDRTFNTDGSLWFPSVGINPTIHPYWFPEFFGNTIMVNGLVWPNINVDQGQYMFRLLDGSNARFYTLWMGNGMPMTVIGSDGGYYKAPAVTTKLTIAPGERYVILLDFSGMAAGTKVVMMNNAKAPYPGGSPTQGATTGQVMQFTVTANPGFAPQVLPAALNPTLVGAWPTLPTPTKTRILTLYEDAGPLGPLAAYLNGQMWDAPISESPTLGSTEDWQIVDMTMDAHPIHTHLVQFQLVSRQKVDTMAYQTAWLALNGAPPYMMTPTELSWTPYIKGKSIPATPIEQAWKDTIQVLPGEVTTFRIRFAPNDGSAEFPFDATVGPGYVWHCHILDHEDNEMMRPYIVLPAV